jgi:alpha-N-acetylglucosamine transferase
MRTFFKLLVLLAIIGAFVEIINQKNQLKNLTECKFFFVLRGDFEINCVFIIQVKLFGSPSMQPKYLSKCKNQATYKNKLSAWVFLTDGDGYANATAKLLRSIRRNSNMDFDMLVMEQSNKPIKQEVRKIIEAIGAQICQVDRIPPRDEQGTFEHFRDQFTKLRLWEMTEYESCVYFDLDCLVIRNIDHMFKVHKSFDSKHKIGVSRDINGDWLDSFNMGVFVVKPNQTEFERIVQLKNDNNFKFNTFWSEQGLLNEVYKNQWYEIGFEYNANLAAYPQARKYWDERAKNISVIHFTLNKPWACGDEFKDLCDIWRNAPF